jgi:uncharacterized RDD family membrane protein YckC
MDPDRWYAFEAGRQIGPMSWAELKSRADAGTLRSGDFVWRAGMPDWVLALDVDGLLESRPPAVLAGASAGVSTSTEGEVVATGTSGLLFAGFWRRGAAFVIDYVIVFAALVATFAGIGAVTGLLHKPTSDLGGFANVVWILYLWAYFAGMESSKYQATLGKRLLGIQVTDLRGRRIDFARASGRHLAKFISCLLCFVGFAMAAFTVRKQALHDVMASCFVVLGRRRAASIPDHEAWAKRHWGDAPSQPADGG